MDHLVVLSGIVPRALKLGLSKIVDHVLEFRIIVYDILYLFAELFPRRFQFFRIQIKSPP